MAGHCYVDDDDDDADIVGSLGSTRDCRFWLGFVIAAKNHNELLQTCWRTKE